MTHPLLPLEKPPEPQVIITYSPTGSLQAETYHNGHRTITPLPPDQIYGIIERLLKGQALSSAAETWAIVEQTRLAKVNGHATYDDALAKLCEARAKKRYELVWGQTHIAPQVKTTKSGRGKTIKEYSHPSLKSLGSDL